MNEPAPADAPAAQVLQYTSAPAGSTIVFDVRPDGLTIIDRPRSWLGRYGASIYASMFIVLALTLVSLAQLVNPFNWTSIVVLAVLWVIVVPLLVDRAWKGRMPGIIEVAAGKLVQIRPNFRGQMVRREWPAQHVCRVMVVPQLWNWQLHVVGELQILLRRDSASRSVWPTTIAVLKGYRLDELQWARAELLRALNETTEVDRSSV